MDLDEVYYPLLLSILIAVMTQTLQNSYAPTIWFWKTLLPYLRTAGAYARQIQRQIQAQPDKDGKGDNFFASALSDADLSIQTMMEVVLLGLFPQVAVLWGEE